MSADHLVMNAGDDVGNVECTGFSRQVGMKQDLQQEIAEFLRQVLRTSLFDGIEDFVGFLDQIGSECRGGLLAVPGTAARGAEAGLHSGQILEKFSNLLS